MSNPLLDTSSLPRFNELRADHALPALRELIAAHRRKLAALLENVDAHDFASLVLPLEEMQHELRRTWSPVTHLQSVLEDPAWRDVYNEGLPLLTEHDTELSQNHRLYEAYRHVAEQLPEDAPAARRTLLAHALRDFRLAGVALPEEQKSQFREIRQQLASIQEAFDQNVQDSTDSWQLHVDEAQLAGLPESLLHRAREAASRHGVAGGWLTLDLPTWQAVSLHADSRELREAVYRGWATRASEQAPDPRWDNSANIERILELRHRAAQLVDFDSYAEYSLATKMASSPHDVTSFLRELAAKTRPGAEAEMAERGDR